MPAPLGGGRRSARDLKGPWEGTVRVTSGPGRRRIHGFRRRAADPERSGPFLRDHNVYIKEAVAHGSGVSIMSARVMAAEVAQGRLVPIPIAAPDLYRPLGIVHRRKKRFHRAAQAFLELLQEQPTAAFAGLT